MKTIMNFFEKIYLKKSKGQTLLEILIVSVIIGIVVASVALLVNTAVNVQKKAKKAETAAKLLNEAQDAVESMAEKNWPYYISTTTDGVHYKIASTTTGWVLQEGEESVSKDNMTFTRYIVFNDVYRNFSYPDFSDEIVSEGGIIDPSTKKLTAYVTSTGNFVLSASEYLARHWNAVWVDTDWSGGIEAGATGGTIDSTYRYAWAENAGWIDFGTSQGNVKVFDEYLTGFAWGENAGWISLNCDNNGSCGSNNYKVANDGQGHLSGYAWSDNAGWINFGPFESASSTVISTTTGIFSGWAWGENAGWISFNCSNTDSCGTYEYYVKTDWVPGGGGGSITLVTTRVPINTFATSTNINYATSGEIKISGIGGGATGGTIDSTYRYAWAENAGWIDFGTSQGNVKVFDEYLMGFAWEENIGWISLHCANDDCDSVDYGVINDGQGHLSGYAWSENFGWINFGPFESASSTVISTTTGIFSGWAWGENAGWISFNCSNTDSCGIEYYVKTDWRPGGGGGGGATGDIDSGVYNHWAWSDEIGWIDFTPGVVKVTSTKLMYYASSSIGEISLDCATSPLGNICGDPPYYVSNNSSGNLAGWAWNDNIGWISFCGNTSGGYSTWNGSTWVCPASPDYQVTIDSAGDFHGWTWSDEIGWISFNCADKGICGDSQYKVKTDWGVTSSATGTLISHIYDLGADLSAETVVLNSVTWKGDGCSANGCKVWLKIASATSSTAGPWEDIDFKGYDGTSATRYGGTNLTAGEQTKQIKIRRIDFNNKRYFRYKIMLQASIDETQSPVVRDVIFNWSR